MCKSIIYKRVVCIMLCLFLVFDVTYTKKQEVDAFVFVLTPAIAQCIITGLAITGVIVGSESFQNASLNFWNSASDGVKEYFHRVSTGAKFLADKTVQFSSNSMEYFKNYVSRTFSSEGGSISDTVFSDKSDVIDLDNFNLSSKRYTPFKFAGRYVIALKDNIYLTSDNLIEEGHLVLVSNHYNIKSSPYVGSKTLKLSIYLDKAFYDCYVPFSNITYTDGILTSIKLDFCIPGYNKIYTSYDVFFDDNIFDIKEDNYYFETYVLSYLFYSLYESTSTISYDYSINSTAYPSTGSICPDVAIDTVIDVPAVNSNVGINSNTANDLLGGVTAVPFNPTFDIPDIGVIAPPIVPPINPDAGFLQKIIDWLSSIWSNISSLPANIALSISSVISKYFDVTEFKLDFSVLKNAGIQNKFPFCIPFDLYNVLKTVLKPGEVDFRVQLDTIYFKIDYMLPINEPIFQLVRNFFRWSALFGFIISLIRGTKNLIKW